MIPEPAVLIMLGSDRVGQVWVAEMKGKRREKGGGEEMGVPVPSSPAPPPAHQRGIYVTSRHTCG